MELLGHVIQKSLREKNLKSCFHSFDLFSTLAFVGFYLLQGKKKLLKRRVELSELIRGLKVKSKRIAYKF